MHARYRVHNYCTTFSTMSPTTPCHVDNNGDCPSHIVIPVTVGIGSIFTWRNDSQLGSLGIQEKTRYLVQHLTDKHEHHAHEFWRAWKTNTIFQILL